MEPPRPVRHPIVFVMGATGTGKSAAALEIAKALGHHSCGYRPHVINCDVMQMHRGLPVATNKPTADELAVAPHHLIECIPLDATPTVGQFVSDAMGVIEEVSAADPGAAFIVCGGTHYYMQSLLVENSTLVDAAGEEDESSDDDDADVQEGGAEQVDRGEPLWDQLNRVDPTAASLLHPNDTRRIARRLQLATKGVGSMTHTEAAAAAAEKMRLRYGPERSILVWVDRQPRASHFHSLDARVDTMATRGIRKEILQFALDVVNAHGVVEEEDDGEGEALPVKRSRGEEGAKMNQAATIPLGTSRGLVIAIGFKEFLPWLEEVLVQRSGGGDRWASNDDATHDAAFSVSISSLKAATRRYARQQRRWVVNRLIPMVRQLTEVAAIRPMVVADTGCSESAPTAVVAAAGAAVVCQLQGRNDEANASAGVRLVPVSASFDATAESDKALRRCELCEKVLCGARQWEDHVKSKGHKGQLKRQGLEARMAAEGRVLPPRKQKGNNKQ